ncbi:MAG: hypothetical protein M3433_05260 [Actinomycetota bacterium]|nr:hypothetical protein [Actinomycetota bacterium]
MDLEEYSLDPVVERHCGERGAALTEGEIRSSMESGGRFLCSVHAADEVPIEEEGLQES